MTIDLTDAIFHDENQARAWLENYRWPTGPYCCHCGGTRVAPMGGKKHRPGLYYCPDCRGQFTVMTNSVMESSHVKITKWVLAIRLMTSSKKGFSAHQLHRSLGVTYKTAWFMFHRLREAMADPSAPPIGGEGKIVLSPSEGRTDRISPIVSPLIDGPGSWANGHQRGSPNAC